MSQQPSVSTSRPSSSMSRPSSVASHRTASRISHRPGSRLSQRPATRQSTRVAPLCQALVAQVTGLSPDKDENYDIALDLVIRRIDAFAKQAGGQDMHTALVHLKRFARKARIQSHSNLAEALEISSEKLRMEAEKRSDLDTEISTSKISDHLQLLICLSSPPSLSTLAYADSVVEKAHNPLLASLNLTWADILKEEPFSGQHWQGAVGLPPGSIVEQWECESSDSNSLSPVSDSNADALSEVFSIFDTSSLTDLSERATTPPPPRVRTGQYSSQEERLAESLKLRDDLEALQVQQHWRTTWRTDAEVGRDFSLSEPATLGPVFLRTSSMVGGSHFCDPENEKYVNEHDAVREILMALQGRTNTILEVNDDENGLPVVSVLLNAPKLLHLTPSAQHSIFSDFADLATSLTHLRLFSSSMISDVEEYVAFQASPSLTAEAFAEAVELHLIQFEAWAAQREEMILRAHLQKGSSTVVSLLSLKKAIRDEFSETFKELLEILHLSLPDSAWLNRTRILTYVRSSPSSFSSRILDTLYGAVQTRHSFADSVSALALMQVFLRTAEPVWRVLGRWLSDGTFIPETSNSAPDLDALPAEFFIESNELLLTDPDFWMYGYNLRSRLLAESTQIQRSDVPLFLGSLAESLLSTGKSIGLLRILDHNERYNQVDGPLSSSVWPTFENFILGLDTVMRSSAHPGLHKNGFSNNVFSAGDLSLLLSDYLLPICVNAGKALHEVLHKDCDFLFHLNAIENLFLLRKGDAMSDFCDILFNAIDSKKVWTDFHFLNSAFRDAVSSLERDWMDSTLVRLSYKANRMSDLHRSVRIFDGLTVQYSAPFPLIYIFDDHASRVYNSIFILLLQIRRAKAALDNILVRGSAANSARSRDELKIFYATRKKLSWFVNVFLDFVCSHILHVEVGHFHDHLKTAASLDDLIRFHRSHLDRLEKLCLLHEETSALRLALLSILDMSTIFSDCFIAFAGDTTLNTSRVSATRSRRHRSRRLRRESRNIVSFAHVSSFQGDDSESSESDLDESAIPPELARDAYSFAARSVSDSFGEEDFFSRNEKITKDLDALVRYIRREVERLALTSESSRSFGVLAFSLQDWDL
ncbi:hypothetical protein M0805_006101 [Coniferiporia weirii]|nr:hypothetical protein M0805_006101 [Coniferiporia weirii]